MKALITGITGMAGSHLADYLIDHEGVEVHGIKRHRSRTEFLRDDITYHTGDINDFSSLTGIFQRVCPDFIFHLAAQSLVPESWTNPIATMQTNVIGTMNIFEAARRAASSATILFAGSSEEYGQVSSDECPITENQPLRPLSPYAVSKVTGDLLAQQYVKSYSSDIIITRAFNHTGPRRGEHFVTSKIARQLALIKLGKAEPVLTLGNLEAVRDFTDVRDTVRAYWMAANACTTGRPYNVGSGVGYPVRSVVHILMKISGVVPEIVQDQEFMRPSDVPRLVADASLLYHATGWKPDIPFKVTMQDLFDYWIKKEK